MPQVRRAVLLRTRVPAETLASRRAPREVPHSSARDGMVPGRRAELPAASAQGFSSRSRAREERVGAAGWLAAARRQKGARAGGADAGRRG